MTLARNLIIVAGGGGHDAAENHVFVQDDAPTSGVEVGSLWVDTTNNLLKRATSISPITFVSVEGNQEHALGSSNHTADTLANLNSKVSDATLVDKDTANAWTAPQSFEISSGSPSVVLQSPGGILYRFRRDTTVVTNTGLGITQHGGKDDEGNFQDQFALEARATEDWTSSAQGMETDFRVTPNGSTASIAGIRISDPGDGEVALLVRRNVSGSFSLQRVSMGAADSGGSGFKVLRVPN